MSKLWRQLLESFTAHPYLSNGIVYGGAEFSQQVITRKLLSEPPKPLDVPNIKRYAFYGMFFLGPALTAWYKWLDKLYPGTSSKLILQKVLMDQFLLTPNLLILFYVVMSIARQQNIIEELKSKLIPTFKTSCCFWLPVQTINFVLIPSTYRVAYVGVSSFVWVNILCCIYSQA